MKLNKWNPPVTYRRAGTQHINQNNPCQDYVAEEEHENYTIIALADGLSSLHNSHHASKEAVRSTLAWFRNNIDRIKRADKSKNEDTECIRQDLIPALRRRISESAKLGGLPLETMDCTLAFVLLIKPKTGDDFAYCGVLGDGAICIISDDPITGMTSAGTLTGYSTVAAATDTIMSPDAQEKLKLFRQPIESAKVSGFLLTTDGLDGAVYKKGSSMTYHALEQYYNAPFSSDPSQTLEKLTDELVKDPYFDDDISIGILSRDNAPRIFPEDPYWLCRCLHKNSLRTSTCIKCGRDYLLMYPQFDTRQFKNEADYFRHLNANTALQRLTVGLLDTDEEEPDILLDTVPTTMPRQPQQMQSPVFHASDSELVTNVISEPAGFTGLQEGDTNQAGGESIQSPAQPQSKPSRKPAVPKEKAVRKWHGFHRFLRNAAAAAAITVLFLTCFSIFQNARFQARMEETLKTLRTVIIDSAAPAKPADYTLFVDLEDGSIYVGPVEDGLPNGYGTVIEGSIRESGTFVAGKQTGMFTVIDLENRYEYSLRIYQDGEVTKEFGPFQIPSADMYGKTVNRQTPLLRDADTEAEQIGVLIPGETVYLTNKYSTIDLEDGELVLYQVYTSYGYIGWCDATAVDDQQE